MSRLKYNYHAKLDDAVNKGEIAPNYRPHLEQVFGNYRIAFDQMGEQIDSFLPLLDRYLEITRLQCLSPHQFSSFHKQWREPFDYYQFGMDFIRPLLNSEKCVIDHAKRFLEIEKCLAVGENVILLANHQAEPDPQAISYLLEKDHPQLARDMIFVAGHRATQDPLAIPFSLGLNLLCIYSKKHIDNPPEKKNEKQLHNRKTMEVMRQLLFEGGKCIYVAPSGGRDRPNAEGVLELSPFDPQSIEMFRIMATKANKPTHFYPLALATYDWFPPPKTVEKAIGELRRAFRTGVKMSLGEKIDMEVFAGAEIIDKKERRKKLAEHIWNKVYDLYSAL